MPARTNGPAWRSRITSRRATVAVWAATCFLSACATAQNGASTTTPAKKEADPSGEKAAPASQPSAKGGAKEAPQRCRISALKTKQSGDKPVLLAVASKADRYILMLPYVADWQVACDEERPFIALAQGSGLQAAINISRAEKQQSPDDYLAALQRDLKNAYKEKGLRMEQTEVLEGKRGKVLRYRLVAKTEKGQTVYQDNFWTSRIRPDGANVDLHLSIASLKLPTKKEQQERGRMIATLLDMFAVIDPEKLENS